MEGLRSRFFMWMLLIGAFVMIMFFSLLPMGFAQDLTFSWDSNPDPSVKYTILCKKTGTTETYKVIKDAIVTNSAVITPITNTDSFDYVIQAYNDCGKRSVDSDVITVKACTLSDILRVTNFKIVVPLTAPPLR